MRENILDVYKLTFAFRMVYFYGLLK